VALRFGEETAKRLFDFVVAGVGLALLAPLLCCIAVLVRLDSPGPILYRGRRSGRCGIPFLIFKFRTMVEDAESKGGMSTGAGDPRLTRIGLFLRKYKFDELPQLLNVLRGEMSVVGPRPEMPAYTQLYQGEEATILSVRPGITDLASLQFIQLSEALGSQDPDRVYEERVRPIKNALRVRYVRERTFRGDLRIIFLTLQRLLLG